MVHIPRSYYDAAVKIYKPIAMEAEGGVPQADLNYATMGWGESWVADEPYCERHIKDSIERQLYFVLSHLICRAPVHSIFSRVALAGKRHSASGQGKMGDGGQAHGQLE